MPEIRPLNDKDLDTLIRIGTELRGAKRYDELEAVLRVAVALAPASAATHHNLGGVYKILGRLEEAETCSRQALALDPAAPVVRHALGIVLLSQGRYREGFPFYEARHQIPSLGNPKPNLPFPEWNGEAISGRSIVLLPEQGFGDAIQSARFALSLERQGAKVTIVAKPELNALFAETLSCQVLGVNDNLIAAKPDFWVIGGSLPGRLGLEPFDIPGEPYLTLGSNIENRGEKLRIGLVTKGDPNHSNDANRTLDAKTAALLMDLPADITSLHPEDTKARDFLETAQLISGLDLVISVDTAVAHLAAAMGKPTWVLIPAANTDWRWGRSGTHTSWYKSMRLFRQPTMGDWRRPVADIRAKLEAGDL